MQWRDIDYAGQTIRVRRSYNVHGGVGSPKSGKVRGVPMVPDVASALARLADREFWVEPQDLVFANEFGTFQDASSIRIRSRARDSGSSAFHDLRHTFGTVAVRRAEVPAVQVWMGHSDIQTTMRYVHHADGSLVSSGLVPGALGLQRPGAVSTVVRFCLCLVKRDAENPQIRSTGPPRLLSVERTLSRWNEAPERIELLCAARSHRARTPSSTDTRSLRSFHARDP